MTKYEYGVGIDPGWKNLGLAIARREIGGTEIEFVYSQTFNPSIYGGINQAALEILKVISAYVPITAIQVHFSIERYVSYQNVLTAESENILMIIGALSQECFNFRTVLSKVNLHRAIDWKMGLVKALYKWKQFQNPSDKLDKKFSIAAAKACITNDKEFDNDHEADATCLASLVFVPGFA